MLRIWEGILDSHSHGVEPSNHKEFNSHHLSSHLPSSLHLSSSLPSSSPLPSLSLFPSSPHLNIDLSLSPTFPISLSFVFLEPFLFPFLSPPLPFPQPSSSPSPLHSPPPSLLLLLPYLPPGQLASTEETDGPSEDIPTSLEVGLLGHVRKVLMLLPDSLVHTVVGDVLQHVCLIAMAHNEDIVVRTAVIRVSRVCRACFIYMCSMFCYL